MGAPLSSMGRGFRARGKLASPAGQMERIAELTSPYSGPDLEIVHIRFPNTAGESLAGGGSTPTQSLPSKLIRIKSSRYSAAQLEQRLRRGHSGDARLLALGRLGQHAQGFNFLEQHSHRFFEFKQFRHQ